MIKTFQTKENGIIYLHSDDMQVATEMIVGAKMIRKAMKELQKRETFKVLMNVDPVTKTLIQSYLKDLELAPSLIYEALGSTVYDKMLMLYDKAENL